MICQFIKYNPNNFCIFFPFKNAKKKMINVEYTKIFIAWVSQIIVLPIIRTNLYIHLLFCLSASITLFSTSFCNIFVIKVVVVLAFSHAQKKKKGLIEIQQITIK